MPETPTFLDSHGQCILKIPGECIYYSGNKYYACGTISNGTTFNTAVQRLVECINKITTTTTSTSTTSTSTSSTTSTTTTSTTSTSTTTSSTTTTTTTVLTARMYWGAQVSGVPPDATAVQAQLNSLQAPAGIINVDWTSFSPTPLYCWAAIPTAYPKTKWYDTPLNNGNIGGGGDLFTTFGTVTISAVSYTIYMTQYQTIFAEATQLQP